MFGLFKKKQPDENQAAIVAANNIAHDFSDLIASGHIEPGHIYDVSMLPHAKDLIEDCCKLWISVCQDSSQLQGWKVTFPMLSQRFQLPSQHRHNNRAGLQARFFQASYRFGREKIFK